MRKLGYSSLPAILLLVLSSETKAQIPAPSKNEFIASVKSFQAQAPSWKKAVNSVSIEELPINYATGKVYEQGKEIVNQDLDTLVLWAGRVEREGSLYSEVNYMSLMQEVQSQVLSFAELVQDFTAKDKATTDKVQAWSKHMNDIANGPLQDLFKTTFAYTTVSVVSRPS
jgi:hypothetical protein